MKRIPFILWAFLLSLSACIRPELHIPGQDIVVEEPILEAELDVVVDMETDWSVDWQYDWDATDDAIWGGIGYDEPKGYQVRRYFTGKEPDAPHTDVEAFAITETKFSRHFEFGYYDILFWSDIDSPDGTQVLVINEGLETVTATTTGTRGMVRSFSKMAGVRSAEDEPGVIGLKNQPEIFYAAYPENIYISHNLEDYDYDPARDVYSAKIETQMRPLVYIYLIQIVLQNNDGIIKGINGNAAMSGMASGTCLNTGHTNDEPSTVYFNIRLKHNRLFNDEPCDIIGGKFTTFGLCDMEPQTRAGSQYNGSREDLNNYLFFDLIFSNDGVTTFSVDVTDQLQSQSHGGVVTVVIDCDKLQTPETPVTNAGSLFVPSVEDYEEVYWELEL